MSREAADSKLGRVSAFRVRLLAVFCAIALYATCFQMLYPAFAASVAVTLCLPVIVVAWSFGLRAAIIASILAFPLSTLLFNLVGVHGWDALLQVRAGVAGTAVMLPIGVAVGFFRDTSIRLAESRMLTRQLMDQAADALYLHDEEGRILDANARAHESLGYLPSELIGMNLAKFEQPKKEDGDPLTARRQLTLGEPVTELCRHLRKDGSSFPVEVRVAKILRAGENVYLGLARSIEIRERFERLRSRFIEQVIERQEMERRRIARELHDESGQWLTSLIAGLSSIERSSTETSTRERAKELRRLSEVTLEELRRLAQGLHPSALDRMGLAATVEQFCSEFAATHDLEIDLTVQGLSGDNRMPRAVEISIYRILQEALTNASRHSEANVVSVVIDRQSDAVRVIIEDDGCGFEYNPADQLPGLGIASIRERVDALKGRLQLESAPGEGTTVAVTLPLGDPPSGDPS